MRLRTRGHDFVLPIIKCEFNKRHFIVCSLLLCLVFEAIICVYCFQLYVYFNVLLHCCFTCTRVRLSLI